MKPQNQLLNDKLGPKGTALYMAPEVMSQKPFDFKADVYSFGLILWELYTQQELFIEFDDWDPFFEAIVTLHQRPEIPSTCIPSLASLMKKCWAHDPEDRPTFKEVLFRLDEIAVDCYLQPGEGKQFIDEARNWWKVYIYIYNIYLPRIFTNTHIYSNIFYCQHNHCVKVFLGENLSKYWQVKLNCH